MLSPDKVYQYQAYGMLGSEILIFPFNFWQTFKFLSNPLYPLHFEPSFPFEDS